MNSKIAIIGGTDLERMVEVLRVRPVDVSTAFGEAKVYLGEGELGDLAFIPRLGNGGSIGPGKINNRANLKALEQLGVNRILATLPARALEAEKPPGRLVVLDQFIDLSGSLATYGDHSRPSDLAVPFCAGLRSSFLAQAEAAALPVQESGTYACLSDDRPETAAEAGMLRLWGASLVGTTSCAEPALARELGLHYGALALAGGWAAGVQGGSELEPADLAGIRSRLLPALLEALRGAELPDCACTLPA